MMSVRPTLKAVVSTAAVLILASCCPRSALAQAPPGPTAPGTGYQPVFGGTGVSPAVREHVDATVTVVAAGDSNVSEAEAAGVLTPVTASGAEARGFYTELNPILAAGWRKPRMQFNATAASDIRSYGGLNEVVVMSHAGQINLNGQFGRGTLFNIGEGLTYAPAFLNGVFSVPSSAASTISSTGASNTFDTEHSFTSGTAVNLTQPLTNRTSVSVTSDLQYTTYRGGVPGYSDVHSYRVGSRWNHAVARNTHILIGYHYGDGQSLGQPANTSEHNVEIGFDHSRMLSATRRSTFAMTLGSSLINGPLLGGTTTAIGNQYHVTGSASYNRQVTRTWFVLGSYQRGLNYIQGLSQPIFTDVVTTSTYGFLTRRIDVSMSGAYSSGDAGPSGRSAFSTYTGDVRLRLALSRSVAIYSEYLYYSYNFNGTFILPAGVPSRLTRNGVRIGLTAWVPVRKR